MLSQGYYTLKAQPCTTHSSITQSFNSTAIPAGRFIWFTACIQVTGLTTFPDTIYFSNQNITSSAFNLSPPNGSVIINSSGAATTVFSGGKFITNVTNGTAGTFFISGVRYAVTVPIAGSLSPITWSGDFLTSHAGVTVSWQWSAACYSQLINNYGMLNIKPIDGTAWAPDNSNNHSGVPYSQRIFCVSGACGVGTTIGGTSCYYTGNYSAPTSLIPCVGSPLPVTLVAFTGKPTNGNDVVLNWTTASEQNSDYFDIERSDNGVDFENIAKIYSHGNSNVIQNYSYTDNSVTTVAPYYRLKSVDLNGSYQYSKTINVPLHLDANGENNVWYNKQNEELQVNLVRNTAQLVSVVIADITGKIVFNKSIKAIKGITNETFNLADLPSGLYMITLSDINHIYNQKIVKF
jgi:hypothetical protein